MSTSTRRVAFRLRCRRVRFSWRSPSATEWKSLPGGLFHLARASIVIDIAVLIAIAIGVRLVHHGLAETVFIMTLPAVSALCGLTYLRSARRRP